VALETITVKSVLCTLCVLAGLVCTPVRAATLVGTTTNALGIDGLSIDDMSLKGTFNVTFVSATAPVFLASSPHFDGNFVGAVIASEFLAKALNDLNVTGLLAAGSTTFEVPYSVVIGFAYFSARDSYNAGLGAWTGDGFGGFPAFTLEPIVFAVFETTTPLPAAFPLFAGGLGVIGLLVRRRKQKAQAA